MSTAERMLWLLALGSAAGWGLFAWWYSLPANATNTHFAFEKVPGGFASPMLRGTLLLFLMLGVVYAAGYLLISRQERLSQGAKVAIVVMIFLPAIANLFVYPVGALDAFNYMIELKLTYGYGENPYLVTFAGYRDDPFALPAFLVDVPLFYGPVWLIAYGLPVAVAGFESIIGLLGALKLFNLGLLALTGLVIYRSHGDDRAGWLGVYLFLANPLVLFEGVGNAHNDVLMTLFLVAALVAFRRKSVIAGPIFALSALVKLFTVVLAPLLLAVMVRDRWGWRRLALAGSLALLVVVVSVMPFWADGAMVDGFRQGTAKSQEMNHVSVLSLAQQTVSSRFVSSGLAPLVSTGSGSMSSSPPVWQPHPVSRLPSIAAKRALVTQICVAVFVVLTLGIAVAVARGRVLEAGVVDTLMLFSLLLTNLYPWYLIPIVASLALWQSRRGLGYIFAGTTLGLAYYPAYVYARFDSGWGELTLHLFLALFLTVPMLLYLIAGIGGFALRFPSRSPTPTA
jgi:alpha-1,6-mannosyltransferase